MSGHRAAMVGIERPLALSVLVGCRALLLYLPFLSRRFDGNGILEALAVHAGGARLWNPSHLLYRPLAAAVDGGLRAFGIGGRSMAVLQTISALCGAITVGVATFIGARLDRDRLRDIDVIWFDGLYPDWRQQFALVTSANGRAILSRINLQRDETDRSAGARRPGQ